MSTKPTTIAVATYASAANAELAHDAVRGATSAGQLVHIPICMDRKGADAELGTGQYGLVIVAANPQNTDVAALLDNAIDTVVVVDDVVVVVDTEGELDKAFESAQN